MPSPGDAEGPRINVAAEVRDLYHIVPCLNEFGFGGEMGGCVRFQAHLEVQIEFTDDLGPVRAVNGYGVNREAGPFEGPFRGCRGRDHGGKEDVPRNGFSCIAG